MPLGPRDLAAVKLHQYFSFNRGDAAAMLRIARLAEAASGDSPHLHGMLAFAHEQLHALDEAEAAARRALALKEKEPWAQHALAHVMLSTGRVREGVDFLAAASRTWDGLNSFMYTHNWWHKALFHISLGDEQAVFEAYDHHVWGIAPSYSQDQVGAVSLLARMEVAGMDVGNRWEELARYLEPRATDTLQPFLTIQYLYGLARAERLGPGPVGQQAVEENGREEVGGIAPERGGAVGSVGEAGHQHPAHGAHQQVGDGVRRQVAQAAGLAMSGAGRSLYRGPLDVARGGRPSYRAPRVGSARPAPSGVNAAQSPSA